MILIDPSHLFDVKYQKVKEHIADFILRIRHTKTEKHQDIENTE